jgi:hypothetical protein
MIAVALGLISLVVMIATGVVTSSGSEDRLTFLGLGVQTTTAQVFVTGAIFGWLFLVAIWLLRAGIHRSGERCAELASRRGRGPGAWLGFGDPDEDDDGDGWDDWSGVDGESGGTGKPDEREPWPEPDEVRFRADRPRSGGVDGVIGGTGGTSAARHGGGAPWRPDGRPDNTNRAVASAADQPGVLDGGHPPGPVAGRFPGIGVDRGAERGQVGGGAGPVPGEDRRADGERSRGDRGQ